METEIGVKRQQRNAARLQELEGAGENPPVETAEGRWFADAWISDFRSPEPGEDKFLLF